MRNNKKAFTVPLLMLIYLVCMQTPTVAKENDSRKKETVFVVSTTVINSENNDQIDLELDIDEKLKKSIDEYLERRHLRAAASADDANYILEYNVEKVEITWPMVMDMSFVLRRRNGEQIFAEKLRTRSIRGWRTFISRTSRTITEKIASAVRETGELTGNTAETTGTVSRAGEGFIIAGNAERLRQERKKASISETRPGAISSGLSYVNGGEVKALSGNVSFEKQIGRNFSVYGKISYLGYEYNYDWEAARGFGSEIGANIYPNDMGFNGPYVGFGVGRWAMEGHWSDQKTNATGRDQVFYDFNLHLGIKLPVSNKIFLNPLIQFGGLHGRGDRDGFENTDLSFFGWYYYNVGLAVGTTW